MKKYELKKATLEVKNENEIVEGCTVSGNNVFDQAIKSFDNKDAALEELKNYKTDVRKLSGSAGTYYEVTEYFVEIAEYDEDGEWIGGGDICDFSQR